MVKRISRIQEGQRQSHHQISDKLSAKGEFLVRFHRNYQKNYEAMFSKQHLSRYQRAEIVAFKECVWHCSSEIIAYLELSQFIEALLPISMLF